MVTFLSDQWIEALDAAASADDALAAAVVGLRFTVEQVVTDGPTGEVRYHVSFHDGSVAVRSGAAADPTVTFRQDHATAVAIASGEIAAQRAFMTGGLQVGGDLRVILDHGDVLAALHDVFAEVRARTHFDLAPAAG